LNSLPGQLRPGDEVIVVDNASADGTEPQLRADFPWVRVLQTGANLGFCAGVNRGIIAGANPPTPTCWCSTQTRGFSPVRWMPFAPFWTVTR